MRMRHMVVGTALCAVVPFASAGAAPQMLGLVATASPAPLTCIDGVCEAEFSAFCLQENRDMPVAGTPYAPVDPAKVTIVARTTDGREIRQPAGDLIRMTAVRAQFAVVISIPEEAVRALGAREVAVEIGELTSAAPVPVAGDPDPLTEGEIRSAAGPLRAVAGNIAETGGSDATAAGITNRLINVLAADGDRREGLWRRSLSREVALDEFDPGVRKAAEYYRICQSFPDARGTRRCLQAAHDGYMSRINIDYWRLVGGGS